jgi:hypothetical protein
LTASLFSTDAVGERPSAFVFAIFPNLSETFKRLDKASHPDSSGTIYGQQSADPAQDKMRSDADYKRSIGLSARNPS